MNIDIAKQEMEEEHRSCITKSQHLDVILNDSKTFFIKLKEVWNIEHIFDNCYNCGDVCLCLQTYIKDINDSKKDHINKENLIVYLKQYCELPIMNINKIFVKYLNLLNLTYEDILKSLNEESQNKIDSFLMKN